MDERVWQQQGGRRKSGRHDWAHEWKKKEKKKMEKMESISGAASQIRAVVIC